MCQLLALTLALIMVIINKFLFTVRLWDVVVFFCFLVEQVRFIRHAVGFERVIDPRIHQPLLQQQLAFDAPNIITQQFVITVKLSIDQYGVCIDPHDVPIKSLQIFFPQVHTASIVKEQLQPRAIVQIWPFVVHNAVVRVRFLTVHLHVLAFEA